MHGKNSLKAKLSARTWGGGGGGGGQIITPRFMALSCSTCADIIYRLSLTCVRLRRCKILLKLPFLILAVSTRNNI